MWKAMSLEMFLFTNTNILWITINTEISNDTNIVMNKQPKVFYVDFYNLAAIIFATFNLNALENFYLCHLEV